MEHRHSKSVMKRLAVQRPKPEPRFVQGFQDGSGLASIRDLHADSVDASRITGRTIAVCNWGCGCCAGEETQGQIRLASKIVKALNFVRDIANHQVDFGDVAAIQTRAREIIGEDVQ